MQQARFNIERERHNRLFFKEYTNDKCLFQFHSQIEIYFVDEGEMEMLVDGKTKTLHAGELSIALSYDTHAYKTPKFSRSSALLIPAHLCEEFLITTKGKRLVSPFITDLDVYTTIKRYYEALKTENISKLTQLGYIYLILGAISDAVTLEDTDSPSDTDLASRILFYLTDNYKNNISPSEVAAHLGYSQSYIARYFKSCFGITLGKYITIVKLKNAVALMHEGKNDITYCALESGFSSMRTFYRAFHNEFGCSPKEYVEQLFL